MSESSWPDAATIRDATRSTRYHSTQATLWANLIQLLCPCPPNTPGTRAYTCTTQQGIQKGRDQPPCPEEQTRRKHELSNSGSTRILQTTYIHTYNKLIHLWWMRRPPTPHHVLLGRQKWRVGKPQIAYSTAVCTEHVTSGVASVDVKTTA